MSLVDIINTAEAQIGESHAAKGQDHAKDGREELEIDRRQRPAQTPDDELAHKVDDDDPTKLEHIAGEVVEPFLPDL